jgi:hypothetical protein
MSTYSIPEFLEFLCRVVEISSQNTNIEDLFLQEKLSAIMYQLGQIANCAHPGKKHNPKKIEVIEN